MKGCGGGECRDLGVEFGKADLVDLEGFSVGFGRSAIADRESGDFASRPVSGIKTESGVEVSGDARDPELALLKGEFERARGEPEGDSSVEKYAFYDEGGGKENQQTDDEQLGQASQAGLGRVLLGVVVWKWSEGHWISGCGRPGRDTAVGARSPVRSDLSSMLPREPVLVFAWDGSRGSMTVGRPGWGGFWV